MDARKEVRIEIIRNFSTQSDFASAIKTDETKVSKVLRGRRKLSPDDAKVWQRKLNCDPKILEPLTLK
jgi:hypothetical protein